MKQNHGPWAYPPRSVVRRRTAVQAMLTAIGLALVVVAFGHIATKAIANAAYISVNL